MKKQDYSVEFGKIVDNTKIIRTEVKEEMSKSFIAYAMAVNVSRAIPDVRDGLKPVHRRILYTMGEMGVFNDKPYRKCARIVGDVMGKYHPHGDAAIYDALVRLAQDFSINTPLVDGHGNFGSVDGDKAAASRYTEARLSKISGELLKDINKNTVDFYPNYDETEEQPRVLPANFPNLLVNGSDGIAVGMATNIPPHNLVEVCDGVIALIDNPEIEVDELINIIPAPDYPTKALIMGTSAITHAYKTGRGGVIIRAKCEIEELGENGKSRIIVTELPYQVNKSKLIISIADLVKDKKIDGIADLKDESDRDGLRMVIDVKKDFNAQVILNYLYKHTQLQISNGIIFLALVKDHPEVLNLKEMLFYYLEHQKEVVTRKTAYDLEKARDKEHILDGLVLALNNVDAVIKTIKESIDKQVATDNLVNKFNFTIIQANAILEMRLQRLTGLEIEKIREELASLKEQIADLIDILDKPQRVLNIIKEQLQTIKETYGVPRKTQISIDYSDINIADLIEKHDVVISLTHGGYVKRQPLNEYRSQRRGGRGITAHKSKEEDYVEIMFVTHSHDDLLFFTNSGRVYRIKAYEVPEASRQAKGRAIVNLLQLSDNERVTAIIPLKDDAEGSLIMATKKGLIKKTDLKQFESIRVVGKIAIKLVEDDELNSVQLAMGNSEVLVASNEGKCIRFKETDVRSMGRDTQGVKCINLADDDYVVDMIVLKEDYKILTISEQGYGKRSNIEDYRLQTRAGKGIKAGVFDEKTGRLVNLKQVSSDEDIMLITQDGIIIRTAADSISIIGRNTKGVKVMRLDEGDKVVSVATSEKESESEELTEGEEVKIATNQNYTISKDSFEEDMTEENFDDNDEE
ncbi:MAG: DNA gyrase subunit A [Clostridia bacterium]|nr:DNA gyrase subunit A [Clostridia bacterium]